MAFVESKLKNVGDQSFYAYIDELRRQEEEKNRQLMERAAARNFASQQQQPIPEWKKVQQQNVGNVGASYAPGYSGIGNQMTWAEGMRRGAAQMGVPVETYLQHMTPIGSGMVSESVSPTEGIPENVLANQPLPMSNEAGNLQAVTQTQRVSEIDVGAKQEMMGTEQEFNIELLNMKREWQVEDRDVEDQLKRDEMEIRRQISEGQLNFKEGIERMKANIRATSAEKRANNANAQRWMSKVKLEDDNGNPIKIDTPQNRYYIEQAAIVQGRNPDKAWELFLKKHGKK